MNSNTKAIVLSSVFFALIFLGIHTLLTLYFNIHNTVAVGVVSAVCASVFSPRRVVLNKQSGKDVYLKWLLSKKVIRFK